MVNLNLTEYGSHAAMIPAGPLLIVGERLIQDGASVGDCETTATPETTVVPVHAVFA